MTAVHVGGIVAEARIVRDTLLAEGIAAELVGAANCSVAGQLPLVDATVSVVVPDADAMRARAHLSRLERRSQLDWVCACGERVPASFDSCWRCGALR